MHGRVQGALLERCALGATDSLPARARAAIGKQGNGTGDPTNSIDPEGLAELALAGQVTAVSISGILGDLAGGFAFWVAFAKFKYGKWTCIARAHVTPFNDPNATGYIIEATGSGPTRALAVLAANKALNLMVPLGYYKRHTHATECWKR